MSRGHPRERPSHIPEHVPRGPWVTKARRVTGPTVASLTSSRTTVLTKLLTKEHSIL